MVELFLESNLYIKCDKLFYLNLKSIQQFFGLVTLKILGENIWLKFLLILMKLKAVMYPNKSDKNLRCSIQKLKFNSDKLLSIQANDGMKFAWVRIW